MPEEPTIFEVYMGKVILIVAVAILIVAVVLLILWSSQVGVFWRTWAGWRSDPCTAIVVMSSAVDHVDHNVADFRPPFYTAGLYAWLEVKHHPCNGSSAGWDDGATKYLHLTENWVLESGKQFVEEEKDLYQKLGTDDPEVCHALVEFKRPNDHSTRADEFCGILPTAATVNSATPSVTNSPAYPIQTVTTSLPATPVPLTIPPVTVPLPTGVAPQTTVTLIPTTVALRTQTLLPAIPKQVPTDTPLPTPVWYPPPVISAIVAFPNHGCRDTTVNIFWAGILKRGEAFDIQVFKADKNPPQQENAGAHRYTSQETIIMGPSRLDGGYYDIRVVVIREKQWVRIREDFELEIDLDPPIVLSPPSNTWRIGCR